MCVGSVSRSDTRWALVPRRLGCRLHVHVHDTQHVAPSESYFGHGGVTPENFAFCV